VRQQLLQLQREGWTESRLTSADERARTGRPATRYSLSEAGDHLFPKSYEFLNVAMIDAIVDEFGPDAAKRILRRVSDGRVDAASATLRTLPLGQRVEALRGLYFERDPFMETEVVEGGSCSSSETVRF
jgi:Predicted transcriptional regulator